MEIISMHQLLSELLQAERHYRQVVDGGDRDMCDRRIKIIEDLQRNNELSDSQVPNDRETEQIIRATIQSIAAENGKVEDHSADHKFLPLMQGQRSSEQS